MAGNAAIQLRKIQHLRNMMQELKKEIDGAGKISMKDPRVVKYNNIINTIKKLKVNMSKSHVLTAKVRNLVKKAAKELANDSDDANTRKYFNERTIAKNLKALLVNLDKYWDDEWSEANMKKWQNKVKGEIEIEDTSAKHAWIWATQEDMPRMLAGAIYLTKNAKGKPAWLAVQAITDGFSDVLFPQGGSSNVGIPTGLYSTKQLAATAVYLDFTG